MFNGIVLGTVCRIVSKAYWYANSISNALKIFLDQMMPTMIGATSITEQQNCACIGIVMAQILIPAVEDIITGKFRCVMACSDGDVGAIFSHIVVLLWQVADKARYEEAFQENILSKKRDFRLKGA